MIFLINKLTIRERIQRIDNIISFYCGKQDFFGIGYTSNQSQYLTVGKMHRVVKFSEIFHFSVFVHFGKHNWSKLFPFRKFFWK